MEWLHSYHLTIDTPYKMFKYIARYKEKGLVLASPSSMTSIIENYNYYRAPSSTLRLSRTAKPTSAHP